MKDPKYNQNKTIQLSRPYYGTTAKDCNYLLFPNPNSYKLNQSLNSKVPINTLYFGKFFVYPFTDLDKRNNLKINSGQMNASKGPYFTTNNVIPSSYSKKHSTNYGKNIKSNSKK